MKRRCQEALAGLTLEPADVGRALRASRHREGCLSCAAAEEDLDWLVRNLKQTDDALDDVSRARVWSHLAEQISSSEQAGREPRVPVSWRGVLVPLAAVAALLLLVANLLVGLARWRAEEAPARRAAPDRRILLPYAASKAPPPSLEGVLGRTVRRLDVPSGLEVRAMLDGRASLLLVGPASMEVTRARPGDVAVRLSHGTLVGSYDGSRGGRLEIDAPGAVAEVVGTLFLVEVPARGRTRVAVAHGRVKVRRGPRESDVVGGGQSWGPEPAPVRAISPHQRRLFRRFEGTIEQIPRRRHEHGVARRTRTWPPISEARPSPGAPPPPGAVLAPAAPTAIEPPPPPGATDLYRQADEALRAGDEARARQLLLELVRGFKDELLVAQARYELAHLALTAGRLDEAEGQLGALLARRIDARLEEPASYLHCLVRIRRGEAALATRCLERFRTRFPASPHDAPALVRLMRLATGDPPRLRRLAREYLRRYPTGRFAAEARRLGK